MKEFKVIPFTPIHRKKGITTLNEVAAQLENNFIKFSNQDWQYERIETITSYVPAKGGCLGFFKSAPFSMSNHFIVFSRSI